jgi:hypothetical protein
MMEDEMAVNFGLVAAARQFNVLSPFFSLILDLMTCRSTRGLMQSVSWMQTQNALFEHRKCPPRLKMVYIWCTNTQWLSAWVSEGNQVCPM